MYSLDPPLINASMDYDYNEIVLVFYIFYFVKYLFKAFFRYIYHVYIDQTRYGSAGRWSLATLKKLTFNVKKMLQIFF